MRIHKCQIERQRSNRHYVGLSLDWADMKVDNCSNNNNTNKQLNTLPWWILGMCVCWHLLLKYIPHIHANIYRAYCQCACRPVLSAYLYKYMCVRLFIHVSDINTSAHTHLHTNSRAKCNRVGISAYILIHIYFFYAIRLWFCMKSNKNTVVLAAAWCVVSNADKWSFHSGS